mmetsp:Transcript_12972/g.38109  ORF Transcript_12972/g.38109 Transcript_12972/m.38109 type:complete len:228 (-) Transcript_12972:225-908(-)
MSFVVRHNVVLHTFQYLPNCGIARLPNPFVHNLAVPPIPLLPPHVRLVDAVPIQDRVQVVQLLAQKVLAVRQHGIHRLVVVRAAQQPIHNLLHLEFPYRREGQRVDPPLRREGRPIERVEARGEVGFASPPRREQRRSIVTVAGGGGDGHWRALAFAARSAARRFGDGERSPRCVRKHSPRNRGVPAETRRRGKEEGVKERGGRDSRQMQKRGTAARILRANRSHCR